MEIVILHKGPDDLDLSGGSDDSDLSFIVQMICDRKTTMSKTKPVLQDLLDPAVRQTAPNVPDIPTAPTVPANSCPVGNFSQLTNPNLLSSFYAAIFNIWSNSVGNE